MEITVLFFGITTDLVGENSIPLTLSNATTIKELKDYLKTNYPNLKNINDFAIAVNEEYTSDEKPLQSNDIVAIIPPVSGG